MKDIVIEAYKDGDEIEINKLFNFVFNKNRDLKEWGWKYKESPIDSRQFIILAKNNDKIIGHYSSIAYYLKYQEKVVKMIQAVDTAIHKDYRGGVKGVLMRMFLKEEELWRDKGIDISFGFPSKEHYIFGKKFFKFIDLIETESLFKRLSIRLSLKRRVKVPLFVDFAGWISSFTIRFFITLRKKPMRDTQYKWVNTFDERIDLFWKKISEQYDVMVLRDYNYLNWRYCKKPGNDYHILQAERDGDIIGILILKYDKSEDVRTGLIMECLAIKEPYIMETLVNKGLIFLTQNRADNVFVRLSGSDPIKNIFEKFGFSPKECTIGSHMVYKTYSSKVDDSILRDASSWHISFGECDSL